MAASETQLRESAGPDRRLTLLHKAQNERPSCLPGEDTQRNHGETGVPSPHPDCQPRPLSAESRVPGMGVDDQQGALASRRRATLGGGRNPERPRAGFTASAQCGHPSLRTAFPRPQRRAQRRPKFGGPQAPPLAFPQVLTLRNTESPLGGRGMTPEGCPPPQARPCLSEGGGGAPQASPRKWGGRTWIGVHCCCPRHTATARAAGRGRARPHLRAAVHVPRGEARPHGLLQQPRGELHRLLHALPQLPLVGVRGLGQLRGQQLQPERRAQVCDTPGQQRPALPTARGWEGACVLESVTLTSSQGAGWPLKD